MLRLYFELVKSLSLIIVIGYLISQNSGMQVFLKNKKQNIPKGVKIKLISNKHKFQIYVSLKWKQIKKMLFYPHCRRKFILDYFWDDEDLWKIWENCGTCDFCIDSKKFETWEIIDLVPLSVFWIILDTIKELTYFFLSI